MQRFCFVYVQNCKNATEFNTETNRKIANKFDFFKNFEFPALFERAVSCFFLFVNKFK